MKLKLPNLKNLYYPNLLVNGDFQINPRGQSTYVFGQYSVAMWFCNGESVGWTENGITFHNIWQKLPPFKNGKYMFSYRKHNTNEQKYIELSSNNATAKDGYLQVTLQTDSNYTKVIIAKDGGGQTDRILFVRLDEGTVKYKHRKEDKSIALMRCRDKIRDCTLIGYLRYNYSSSSLFACIFDEKFDKEPTVTNIKVLYYPQGSSAELKQVDVPSASMVLKDMFQFSLNKSDFPEGINCVMVRCIVSIEPL